MAARGKDDEKQPSFEEHLQALEKVVTELEGDALSLEASIDRYKEGVARLAACRKILDAAEQRLLELTATPDGGVAETPLEVGPEGLVDAGPSVGRAAPSAGRAPKSKPPPPPADDDMPF